MFYTMRFFLLLVFLPAGLFADALVISRAMQASTIAEVFIEPEAVRIELEIGMGDIPAFKNLLPDALYERLGGDPEPWSRRRERFFNEEFVLEADGTPLSGHVLHMEPRKRLPRDDITGLPLPSQGAGEDILFAELVFPVANRPEQSRGVLPDTLSFSPPVDQERGYVAATIGLMVYHMGLPVMDFRYLSRKETLQLDWDDPWYSRFHNKNLWRQYNEPISAFLYAEPFETRIEVIARPKDIQQWHDLGIEGMARIPVESQPALKAKIAEFLLTQMDVLIDGNEAVPTLQRVNFLERTLKSSTVVDPPGDLDAVSATLGIIYSIPTESLPKEARLTWNLFSPKMQVVRSASIDEAGPLPYKLRPDDNVLIWKNFLKNPTLPSIQPIAPPLRNRLIRIPLGTLICLIILWPLVRTIHREKGKRAAAAGGAALMGCAILIYPLLNLPVPVSAKPELSDEAASKVVSSLLKNVYTSFDFRGESAIYDALGQSLSGELLADVYLQTIKSLELASQGGARVKVKEVTLNTAEFKPKESGIDAICTWDVIGAVGHWGHIHQRKNRYEAELAVQPVDGHWKITRLEILQEERIN
jgi:hypothetical protein